MGEQLSKSMLDDTAKQIALDFLKKTKNIERIDTIFVKQVKGVWIVTVTRPINLDGHPWAERFEVIVDNKGKIKSMTRSLL